MEDLPPRDRALLHELVLGTLRARGSLDHALAPLLDVPLERLEPPVRRCLRLGAYQVLRLRVPARAAVSQAVDLARESAPRAAGLVNAVLRRLAREGPPPALDPVVDPRGWLTTEGSLPPWLAERWLERLGPSTSVARARALLAPPPSVFRLNPRASGALERLHAAGVSFRPLAVPGAWQVVEGRVADLASEGVLYLQDQGAQMVAHLAASPGSTLDACAAPGGKTTLLADLAGDQGRIIAAEASARRLRTLASLVRRWGSPNVRVVGADALRPPFRRPFDAVLLDAPCTGLGTLGRHPDIRWRAAPGDLERHSARQREMLDRLAPLVRPGGSLVYATCSLEPEENEGVVASFLQAGGRFSLEGLPGWTAPFSDGRFARTLPEREGGDGFFAAVLRRA